MFEQDKKYAEKGNDVIILDKKYSKKENVMKVKTMIKKQYRI